MNQLNDIISAIDIGTTKIVAIIGKKEIDGKFRILGIGKAPSKGVKRGNVLNIEETVNSIKAAVEIAEQKAQIKVTDVYVGIAGQNIKCIRNSGYVNRPSYDQEITAEDVDFLTQDQYRIGLEPGEEIIHVLPQSYSVDGENGVKPIGICGKRLEGNFHIVIGKTMNIKNLKRCVERAGLRLKSLVLEPLASSSAVLTEDEKEAGVALIDIGGGTTDLAIYYEGTISHTAVVPFGGNVLTSDVKSAYNILERHAEELKMQFGSALAEATGDDEIVTVPGVSGRNAKEISQKSLANVLQARMEEIIGAIEFQIENSGYADRLGAGIVLTGGGALLKNLPQLVSFKTGHEIRIGYPIQYLTSDVKEDVNSPMYSTSVGLMMIGEEEMRKSGTPSFAEPIVEEKVVEAKVKPDLFFDEEEEIEPPKKKEKVKKESKISSGKNKLFEKLSSLFDDTDTKINE
ncbi:MAG: cell division protein FtsA [Bacteroidia bacterium]|nr:cell division protein FtsA [Bacteroidia bacterium]